MSAFSPGGSSNPFDRDLLDQLSERIRGKVDARAPEDLPEILNDRQSIGIVRRDMTDPRGDREGHFHHFIQGRLVAAGAQRAVVFLAIKRLERGAGVEHTAAAGTQHVPGEVEDPKPCRVQEGSNHAFFVETRLLGEIKHVDAAQRAIGALAHQLLDRRNCVAVGRLPQNGE